jgi:hypothetical protein
MQVSSAIRRTALTGLRRRMIATPVRCAWFGASDALPVNAPQPKKVENEHMYGNYDVFRGDPEVDPIGYEVDQTFLITKIHEKEAALNDFFTPEFKGEDADDQLLQIFLEDGMHMAEINGQKIVVPDCENTLEWVLNTPIEYHCFDEVPVVVDQPDSIDLEE